MKTCLATLLLLFVVASISFSQTEKSALVDREDTTAFIQLEADSFNSLTPQQKKLAYYLEEASVAIDPIIYDQLSKYGLRQKRLLEEFGLPRLSLFYLN